MKGVWQTVIGVTVSLLLLYWALHDISLAELWRHLREADLWLLGLSIVIQTALVALRAMRWTVFLHPALPDSRFRPRFASTCIGFMANNLLPARVGEFARAYALSKSAPIGTSAAFGSLVVERIFDALVLATFLAVPVLLPGFIEAPGLGDALLGKVLLVFLIFGGAAGGLALLIWKPDLMIRVFMATLGRLLPRRLAGAIEAVMKSFISGLGSMRNPRLVAAGLIWSLVLWGAGGLAFFVGLLAFDIRAPGYLGALFLQAVNAFAVAIPSSPGFFGPFEASVRLALSPFGIAPGRAVSFAAAFHIGTFIPVTVIGIYYLGRLGLTWGEVGHSEELVEERTERAAAGRPEGQGA